MERSALADAWQNLERVKERNKGQKTTLDASLRSYQSIDAFGGCWGCCAVEEGLPKRRAGEKGVRAGGFSATMTGNKGKTRILFAEHVGNDAMYPTSCRSPATFSFVSL